MRTKVILLSGLTLFGITGLAVGGDRSFGDGVLPEPLQIYDLDDDGNLSEEERQAMLAARKDRHEALKGRWDTDGDGIISPEERAVARAALLAKIQEHRLARFNAADTDGDDSLSPEEFAAIPALAGLLEHRPERVDALFDRLDENDDSLIAADEFLSRRGGRNGQGPGGPGFPGDGGSVDRPEDGPDAPGAP